MTRSRGFSLLEVMLALVVVAIGISVLLTFSASSQRETSNKASGNDYSLIVNDILEQFVNFGNDAATCGAGLSACTTACGADNTCQTNCKNACNNIAFYPNETAYDYLCQNPSHSQNTCENGKISDTQRDALQNAGISITTNQSDNNPDDASTAIQVGLTSCSSDTEHPDGCPAS